MGSLSMDDKNSVLDGSVASEVSVDAINTAHSFDAFAQTFYILYNYGYLVCVVVFVPSVRFILLEVFAFSPIYGP